MQRDQAHRTNELLERIAKALEVGNITKAKEISGENTGELTAKAILDSVKVITDDYGNPHPVDKLQGSNEIPGFEGTLDALDDLCNVGTNPKNDPERYLFEAENKDEYETDGTSVGNGKYEDDPYTYEHELDKNGDNSVVEYKEGIINDSDHEIRKNACFYESILNTKGDNDYHEDLRTKKDCILDYVTNEFGILGARYTDIIKFAYYLGSPNAPKYDNTNRGYYSMAFAPRYGGFLVKGGKDYLVKGINNGGDERYFSLDFVDQATEYYKRIK